MRQTKLPRAQNPDEVVEAIRAAIASGVPAVLNRLISGYHPIDIAIAMRELSREHREAVFDLLTPEDSGVVLEEVDDDVAVELAEATDEEELAQIIDVMPPDVGADVVNLLDEAHAHRILERIPDVESDELELLRQYAPDTAGGIMTSEVIYAPLDVTAGQVIAHIKTQQIPPEGLLYIYIVDDDRVLRGVMDMAEIVTAPPDQPLSKAMVRDVVSITPEADQTQAVRLVDQYDLSALPVVNEAGQLLGQVTVDDIIDAIQQEHTEDIAHFAGTSPRDIEAESSLQIVWLRMPWLGICFLGTLLAAGVIKSFGSLLQQYVELAAFIPVINATSGNAGLQSATISVRALSLGYLQPSNVWRVVARQLGTAAVMAVITGVAAGVAGDLIMGKWQMGIVVSIGMTCSVAWASTMGAVIPMLFERVGIDPAVASGPLVSTSNDVVAVIIYLTLASHLLAPLGA